jgi:glyoxylase-like metal-dependent hydrolase (beta-lactamase superfamily II)
MAAAGLNHHDVSEVVLAHAHGDHIDGLVHVRSRVLIHDAELRSVHSRMARVIRRMLRQPLPRGFGPETFVLNGGPDPAVRPAPDSVGRFAGGSERGRARGELALLEL